MALSVFDELRKMTAVLEEQVAAQQQAIQNIVNINATITKHQSAVTAREASESLRLTNLDAREMKFSECLKSHGVTALWHMTHLDNLESILAKGIFCKNSVQNQVAYKDISDSHVQSRRGGWHKYVPFYFADNTAMLYNVASSDGEVVMLQVDTEAADCEGVQFSDGNLAANATRVFDDPAKLSELDWNMIQGRQRAMFGEWKRKRMAEVLVPSHCAASHIRVVHVQALLVSGVCVADLCKAVVSKFPHLNISLRVDLTEKGVR